jgi:hypothetical protein
MGIVAMPSPKLYYSHAFIAFCDEQCDNFVTMDVLYTSLIRRAGLLLQSAFLMSTELNTMYQDEGPSFEHSPQSLVSFSPVLQNCVSNGILIHCEDRQLVDHAVTTTCPASRALIAALLYLCLLKEDLD